MLKLDILVCSNYAINEEQLNLDRHGNVILIPSVLIRGLKTCKGFLNVCVALPNNIKNALQQIFTLLQFLPGYNSLLYVS